jgi:hypothetical protein
MMMLLRSLLPCKISQPDDELSDFEIVDIEVYVIATRPQNILPMLVRDVSWR